MSTFKFKVGDKVTLKDDIDMTEAIDRYGFMGRKDVVYTIEEKHDTYDYRTYRMYNSNWCKEKWLRKVDIIYLGGE